jgi:hypothetical protein
MAIEDEELYKRYKVDAAAGQVALPLYKSVSTTSP